ncbi:unnamed protein product [Scytosiphon promiscuus]
MSLINRGANTLRGPLGRTLSDAFRSMERDMLAPWGLASRFPNAGDAFTPLPGDMNLDFHETKGGFKLTADLPGMREKDISVDVDTDSGVLTVSGERKEEREEKSDGDDGEKKYHFVERSYGKMTRSIRLPETADTSNATADYSAGVLNITFPKREAPTPSRLQIPIGGTGSSDDGK